MIYSEEITDTKSLPDVPIQMFAAHMYFPLTTLQYLNCAEQLPSQYPK